MDDIFQTYKYHNMCVMGCAAPGNTCVDYTLSCGSDTRLLDEFLIHNQYVYWRRV